MHNQKIIDVFEKLWIYHQIIDDKWREQAYRKIISSLKNYDKPIKSAEEALQIPGIGKGTATKIGKILKGESITDILDRNALGIIDIYSKLRKIRDIGDKKAKELIKKYNVRSIDDLRKLVSSGKVKLNESQLIGLKYYDDLTRQIPHDEIKQIEDLFKKIAKSIDPNLEVYILGSYRRKRPFSNVMLLHPEIKTPADFVKHPNFIQLFVNKLTKMGIIDEELKTGSLNQKQAPKSINLEYLIKTPFSKHRRKIDLKFYAYESKIPAILYFTGSKDHNRRIRDMFKNLGYLLNQYGLYKKLPGGKIKMIPLKKERDVYDILKIPFLLPEQRVL